MEITKEVIEDYVSDTTINGKYHKLYQMIVDEIEEQVSDKRLRLIIETLEDVGIDCCGKSSPEILFEYSKLI